MTVEPTFETIREFVYQPPPWCVAGGAAGAPASAATAAPDGEAAGGLFG